MSEEKGLSTRPFADVVRELAAGQTYEDATVLLARVVNGVLARRKPGKFTLELTIEPNGENAVTIRDKITVKIPEPARPSTVFFSQDGALMREDPRQQRLPLRTVNIDRQAEPAQVVEPERQPLRQV